MSEFCRIVVTTGPDRGKVFEPAEELVHIGRAAENHVVLDDPSLSEHQASLLRKNGRYAIYRPADADVQVDGQAIPAEQWVWLPGDVRIQFGRRTTCRFSAVEPVAVEPPPRTASAATVEARGSRAAARPVSTTSGTARESTTGGVPAGSASMSGSPSLAGSPSVSSSSGAASGIESRPGDSLSSVDPSAAGSARDPRNGEEVRRRKARAAKPGRNVARFITDQGDPLVELGADGHLPELALKEGPSRRERTRDTRSSSPAVLYGVLGLSLLATVALLLIDPNPPGRTELSRTQARDEITRFFGSPDQPPQSWQKALRAARLAHSRGDRQAELAHYRQVLAELNSEDRDPHIGLTGHLSTDEELHRLISVIISP